MLVLTRPLHSKIYIGNPPDQIVIEVSEIRKGSVELTITADKTDCIKLGEEYNQELDWYQWWQSTMEEA